MNDPKNNPLSEIAGINDRVDAAVRAQRMKIRVLTGIAFLFGFIAVGASTLLVMGYLFLILPKQNEMLQDVGARGPGTSKLGVPGQVSLEDAVRRMNQFIGTETEMVHAISVGVTLLAVAVGVLGIGTLTLLTVVIMNRRTTFNQISASLAQLSAQLRDMSTPGPSGARRT